MNLNNLITMTKILSQVHRSQIPKENCDALIIGYGHIKAFIDCYYSYLAEKDIDLAMTINKSSKVPKLFLRGNINIDEIEDGEIIHQLFWVVFQRKNNKKRKEEIIVSY